jgi:reductive dehalogenase
MKGLGLAGAGLGAAAAAAPVFHDLDEAISAPSSFVKRPWWIKERDLFDPTTDVDWDIIKRYDRRINGQTQYTFEHYPEFWSRFQTADAAEDAIEERRLANQEPGWDLKYVALNAGQRTEWETVDWCYAGIEDPHEWSKTPQELGHPPWRGTPEEASRLVRAALRFFGMSFIGFAELDSTWRNKLLVTHTTWRRGRDAGKFVYEDVPRAYSEPLTLSEYQPGGVPVTGEKCVIPNKPCSLVVMAVTGSREARKRPSIISSGNRVPRQNFHEVVQARLFNFLRTLGDYQVFGMTGHQSMVANTGAADILTGIAENSRQNNYNISPEMGPHYNPFNLMTDLPLAPTKPIDAGMFRFCASCGKCARLCPGQTISTEEASWDIPSKEGKVMTFHNPGVKNYWADSLECRDTRKRLGGCGVNGEGGRICYACCVFGEDDAALMHSIVRGTVATTGIFNGFLANMSDFFDYGVHRDPEEWWDLSLPAFGMDTTVGVTHGGYNY